MAGSHPALAPLAGYPSYLDRFLSMGAPCTLMTNTGSLKVAAMIYICKTKSVILQESYIMLPVHVCNSIISLNSTRIPGDIIKLTDIL